MQKNDLFRQSDSIFRVLSVREDTVLAIDCLKQTMPKWIHLENAVACTEDELRELADIHEFIAPQKSEYSATVADKSPKIQTITEEIENPHLISDLVNRAKTEQMDIVALLREHFSVDEVAV